MRRPTGLASWQDRGSGEKVAGAAGAAQRVGDGGRRFLRAAGWLGADLLGSPGSALSALGRAAVPRSALPLIDWPACAATLHKLGPAGGTGGRRRAGDRREQAGPGREKTWKRGVGSGAARSTS